MKAKPTTETIAFCFRIQKNILDDLKVRSEELGLNNVASLLRMLAVNEIKRKNDKKK